MTELTDEQHKELYEALVEALAPDLRLEMDFKATLTADGKLEIGEYFPESRNTVPMDIWNGEREPDEVLFFAEAGYYDEGGGHAEYERRENPTWTFEDGYSAETIEAVADELMEHDITNRREIAAEEEEWRRPAAEEQAETEAALEAWPELKYLDEGYVRHRAALKLRDQRIAPGTAGVLDILHDLEEAEHRRIDEKCKEAAKLPETDGNCDYQRGLWEKLMDVEKLVRRYSEAIERRDEEIADPAAT